MSTVPSGNTVAVCQARERLSFCESAMILPVPGSQTHPFDNASPALLPPNSSHLPSGRIVTDWPGNTLGPTVCGFIVKGSAPAITQVKIKRAIGVALVFNTRDSRPPAFNDKSAD